MLAATKDQSTVDLGASLGVDASYVGKLRGGWRPTRLRPEIWSKFLELDPGGAGADVSEAARYAISVLRIIERHARAVVDSAAEAQLVLSAGPITPRKRTPDELLYQAREMIAAKKVAERAAEPPRRAKGQ